MLDMLHAILFCQPHAQVASVRPPSGSVPVRISQTAVQTTLLPRHRADSVLSAMARLPQCLLPLLFLQPPLRTKATWEHVVAGMVSGYT